MSPKVRMNLEMSEESYSKLENLAGTLHTSKSDVLRRALALIDYAVEAAKDGKKFGLSVNGKLDTEIKVL
jgi:predicted transcriptional regulator